MKFECLIFILVAAGCADRNGADGAQGPAGLTSLVRFSDEPAGAHCTNGGSRIDSGVDANANGELDAGEVSQTQYVCSGVSPARTLITTSAAPVGGACPTGGSHIDVGVDRDNDGILDAEEVTSTSYVCNGVPGSAGATGDAGAPGAASLVSIVPEPAGSNCGHGGQRINTGLDSNANGQLDSVEIVSSAYVCNGVDGASGASVLVAQIPELPGANCASGGVAVRSGLDSDGNGVLDAAEVTATSYVCNGPQYFPTGWSASPLDRIEIGNIGDAWIPIHRDTSIFKLHEETILKVTVTDNASFAYGAVSGGIGYYAVLIDGGWVNCYSGMSNNIGSSSVTAYVHQPFSMVCVVNVAAGLHTVETIATSQQGTAYIGWQSVGAQVLVEELSTSRLAYSLTETDAWVDSPTWVNAADRDVTLQKQSPDTLLKITLSDSLRAGYPTGGEARLVIRMDGVDTTCLLTTYDFTNTLQADFHAPVVMTCVLAGVPAGAHDFSVWIASSNTNDVYLGYLAHSLLLIEEVDATGVYYVNGPSSSGDVGATVDTQVAGRSLSVNLPATALYKLTYSDTFRGAGDCNAASGYYAVYVDGVLSISRNATHFNLLGAGASGQDHYRAINETSLWTITPGPHTFTVWGRADCGANSFGYGRGQVLMLLEPLR